jgi:hypothetical protein
MAVERYKDKQFPHQFNVWLNDELKQEIDRLKRVKRIKVSTELRKRLRSVLQEIENDADQEAS